MSGSAPKLPTALKFIRQVNFPDEPECVCRYNGVTYVGLYSGVAKVCDDKTTGEMIIDDVADATGLFIYKDEIYVLVNDVSYFKMYVYDLQGKRKREWDTRMHCVNHGMIKFAVINDKVVIPHHQEDLLLIYSLTGESLKNIPCPLGSCDQVYIHTANHDCVIVSPCNPMGPLFKINIENGDILWRKSNLKSPNGAVSYKVDYLLVCARDSTDYHISMLNIHTGEHLADLTMPDESKHVVLHGEADLAIGDDTLIATQYGDSSDVRLHTDDFQRHRVLYFELI